MDLPLGGKLSLVTGSTAGIGYAIAAALAREGVRASSSAAASPAAVEEAVARLEAATGGYLVGFAGDLTTAAAADQVIERFPAANVLSGVRLARRYLPGMRRRDWGRIIFISSESAIQIPAEMIHYGMTNAAQVAVARGLAEAVAGTGITVNSVLPGPTRSRGVQEMVESRAATECKTVEEYERGFFETVRPTSLIQRFTDPEEVAALVPYLASPLAAAITGAPVRVDGGVVKSAF